MLTQPTIENIFLQGGSVKGTAYIGAFRALMNHIDMNKVKRMAGTSAGAIGASLLAIGYSIDELEHTLKNLAFESFLDGSNQQLLLKFKDKPTKGGFFRTVSSHPSDASASASHLSTAFGLCQGEIFRIWLEKKITCKLSGMTEQEYDIKGPQYLTFAELHALAKQNPATYKDLYVITVNATTQEAEILSFETKPNAIISDAVRCSMSIPIVFEPCHLYEKTRSGIRQVVDETMIYVDGGVTDNYRPDLFDFARYIDEIVDKRVTHKIFNPHTLGLKLAPKGKKDYYENITPAAKTNFRKFIPFIIAIVKTMHYKQHVDFMHANDLQRTIIIDTLDVDTLDFDLSDAKKDALIQSGHQAVTDYFTQRARTLFTPPTLLVDTRLFLKIAPFFEKMIMATQGNQMQLTNFTLKDNHTEQLRTVLTEDNSAEALQLIAELGLQPDALTLAPTPEPVTPGMRPF